MRKAKVLYKDQEAGHLLQHDDGSFTFQYQPHWLENPSKPAISLRLPKREAPYHSKTLFSSFCNMMPEGSNKAFLCQLYRIDPDDHFGLLVLAATYDSIGAIRLVEAEATNQ